MLLKRYYILTAHLDVVYIGEFENFSMAWDFVSYEENISFVYLFKEENLLKLVDTIQEKVKEQNRISTTTKEIELDRAFTKSK